jgi:plasmid stability protein
MATLHVRNVPDDLYEQLKQLAASEKRSISAQVVTLLDQMLPASSQKEDQARSHRLFRRKTTEPAATVGEVTAVLEEISHRRQSRNSAPELPDSTALLREDRER